MVLGVDTEPTLTATLIVGEMGGFAVLFAGFLWGAFGS